MMLNVAIFIILFLSALVAVGGAVQRYRYKKNSKAWPVVEATVVGCNLVGSDPPDYVLEVRYEFNGRIFTSIARDHFHLSSDTKKVGDKLSVKIEPSRNSVCYIDN
ncbi:DUF3592 domain-containing protein [Mesorhizobium sp. M1E.F.Ca.ET.041.01.1.1]|uniref:DUF3592 domain-containing protein n=2 Tax=Mesorhizobium sp. TaxID=1871066 RepID=UPI000FC9C28C|nr:DUF3592 domain-containing protein [Mesorhizobium sp. M1E.F.Ca.ET.041.01.1.1]RWB51149.1 MAG: DUF3592 domain-containing protein [Mesorhizobium sp.]RWD84039.1 MAG: DUF3592 domain-containing protein [Mesorhizobium sp.]RWD92660.1 MAG: DUF3592 domain-containing protein [Mesorhizobium sp.]TIV51675.1 MAG: DUF3592 domain-containing protein [Mesorhizobium sp.]